MLSNYFKSKSLVFSDVEKASKVYLVFILCLSVMRKKLNYCIVYDF